MDIDSIKLEVGSFAALWDFGNPALSEQRFQRFEERARDASLHELAALSCTQRARALGLQRRFDDGHALLDAIERDYSKSEQELKVRLCLERGRLLNSSGKQTESVQEFEEAWGLASKNGLDGLAVDSAHMLGIVCEGDVGMDWNEQAMNLAMSSDQPDARKWRGSLLNNIGWNFHDAGNYERALALFEDALIVRQEEGAQQSIRVARWCVGRCLRSLDRIGEAIEIQRALESDPNADGYVLEEIAECLLALDRREDAKPYFTKAHALLSQDDWLQANESERLDRLSNLGI